MIKNHKYAYFQCTSVGQQVSRSIRTAGRNLYIQFHHQWSMCKDDMLRKKKLKK